MKNLLLLLFTVLASHVIAQDSHSWNGRYFKDLQGSTWISDNTMNDATPLAKESIGLRLLTFPADSLKTNAMIWVFTDVLTIKYYDALTKEYSIILTCAYENNEEQKQITLVNKDTKKSEAIFNYLPVSTGSYVQLTKPGCKKKS